MAQIFKPAANTIATVSLFAGAAVPFLTFYLGSTVTRSPYNTMVGVPLEQPIPFSHKHHAKELGIDCRFCHAGVEENAVAGVPSTEVCMTCHSQIWTNSPLLEPLRKSYETGTPIEWVKVNKVPDFVYFDHSIHVNRGISCNSCHGAIQEMQITAKGQTFHMSWCLECHRAPEEFMVTFPSDSDLTPRQQVFNLYEKLASGEKLTPLEHNLSEGIWQHIPNDAAHAGVQLMKERGINKAQLMDCYICHR